MLVQMGPPGTEGSGPSAIPGNKNDAPTNEPAGVDDVETIVMKPDMAAMKRFKSLRDLAPDSPAMKLFQDTCVLLIDLFKLSMASMLSVFVPQLCPASTRLYEPKPGTTAGDYVGPALASFQDRADACTDAKAAHDCTFRENFICLSTFNQFVLAWNFICLATLIFHYFLVWRRENFLILHFKETLTLGRLHVRDIISDYPTMQIKLRKFNSWVFNTSVIAIVLQSVNVVTSAVLLFGYYDDGYKTFTTFFTSQTKHTDDTAFAWDERGI